MRTVAPAGVDEPAKPAVALAGRVHADIQPLAAQIARQKAFDKLTRAPSRRRLIRSHKLQTFGQLHNILNQFGLRRLPVFALFAASMNSRYQAA